MNEASAKNIERIFLFNFFRKGTVADRIAFVSDSGMHSKFARSVVIWSKLTGESVSNL